MMWCFMKWSPRLYATDEKIGIAEGLLRCTVSCTVSQRYRLLRTLDTRPYSIISGSFTFLQHVLMLFRVQPWATHPRTPEVYRKVAWCWLTQYKSFGSNQSLLWPTLHLHAVRSVKSVVCFHECEWCVVSWPFTAIPCQKVECCVEKFSFWGKS